MDNVRDFWSRIGASEPHFGVLTNPKYLRKAWNADAAKEFDESGESFVQQLDVIVRGATGKSLSDHVRGGTVVDFGSGVGRIARRVAPLCSEIVCVDVSPGYLSFVEDIPNARKKLRVDANDDVGAENAKLVYSVITLQHNCPDTVVRCVAACCRALAPDGLAVLHVPYECNLPWYVPRNGPVMQMHATPAYRVEAAARGAGCVLHERVESAHCGSGFRDAYFVFKPTASIGCPERPSRPGRLGGAGREAELFSRQTV